MEIVKPSSRLSALISKGLATQPDSRLQFKMLPINLNLKTLEVLFPDCILLNRKKTFLIAEHNTTVSLPYYVQT